MCKLENNLYENIFYAVDNACQAARKQIASCAGVYKQLSELIPIGQYYRLVNWQKQHYRYLYVFSNNA